MSVRNLDKLFAPRSVALIGATPRPGSVGAVVARNPRRAEFAGEMMLVNPHHDAIDGLTVHPDVASLPKGPDLAIIVTPPDTVPGLVGELAERGTRAAVVITAGFGELGKQGGSLQQAMLDAAKPHLLRIVGPNCVGIMVPRLALDATFSHLAAPAGDIAFISQSGAMITAMLDWAVPRGIGFSHVVSLGDMADVDFGDMLDYLAADSHTRAILLYVEGVTHGRKFMSAARAASRIKPVLVLKAGRSNAGARAATSHTGVLADSDAVYDAAFRRAGMLRVRTVAELFDAVETLASTHAVAARLSQLDYDRELPLLAELDGTALGVAHFFADPDKIRAEYAIAIRSDWKGRGVGYLLMTRLIGIAKQRGIAELVGEVLRENGPMLQMCHELRFEIARDPSDPSVMQVRKRLASP